MKKLFLTWSAASFLALFYTACGDDVIHVHNDEYAIVDSLDSLACNGENEGEMALVKSTGVLYACTDGEWSVVNASEAVDLRCKSEPLKDSSGYKIICDGKTIGTVQNGTDGQNGQKGADGKAGQNGADGKAGQNGKEVNVDSVSRTVSKKVTDSVIDTLTEMLVDSLSCRMDSSWTDTEASLINVKISCGSGSSIIQLPTLIPNKNLTKHYKKTVMFRFPYQKDVSLYDFGNSAELTVMEVDSNFERTGKNFVSELYLTKQTIITTYEDPSLYKVSYYVSFLANDVDITNMMNSYAQFRVRLDRSNGSGNGRSQSSEGTSEIVYMAFVNMDDGDTIVVDFVSDYKAARIETLMKKKGTDFAKASKQANDEITEALALGKDFYAVDFYMSDTIEINEISAAISWPMVLSSLESSSNYVSNYNRTYADYRELFAKEGNFKTAINQPLFKLKNGFEYPIFFIDYYVVYFNLRMNGQSGEIPDTQNAYEKITQHGLKDAYELPACNLEQAPIYESQVTGGLFKYFKCDGRLELWYPIARFNQSIDAIASSIAGECNDSTAGKFFIIDSMGTSIVAECKEKSWKRSNDMKSAICNGKQEGSLVSGVGGMGTQYFQCVADSTGDLVGKPVSYYEYTIGEVCNAETKDSLFTLPEFETFFRCDTSEKAFVPVYEIDPLARIQLGECDSAKVNEVDTIYATKLRQGFVVCKLNDNGVGKWLRAEPIEVMSGVCTETLMKTSAIYKMDSLEWKLSDRTGMEHYKCDCDYVWEETADGEVTVAKRSYVNCRWTIAGNLDLKLNKACNSSIIDTVVSSGSDEYTCDQIEKYIGSSSSIHRDWNQVDPDRECPRIVAPNGGEPWLDEPCNYRCDYAGRTFYYSLKRGGWITLADGETCLNIHDYCEQNKQNIKKEECAPSGGDCYAQTASVCLVKDSVHEESLREEIVYSPPYITSASAYRTGEELCNKVYDRYDPEDESYLSRNVVYSYYRDYIIFLSGYTMEGTVLPEVYKIRRDSASNVHCIKVTDVQTACSAMHSEFVEENGEESSCDHPCLYGGIKYYYNFNYKNGPNDYGKWMTLEEMGLTQCSSVEDYCDNHNTLSRACTTVDFCEETENAEGCVDYDDYDSWTCPEYPFMRMTPRCQDGIWYSGQA